MTTFDSGIEKFMHEILPGGKVGPVTTNSRTDVVLNDSPSTPLEIV